MDGPRVGRSRHHPATGFTACQSDRPRPGRRRRGGRSRARSPSSAPSPQRAANRLRGDAVELAGGWQHGVGDPHVDLTRPAPRSSWSPGSSSLRALAQNQSHVTVGGCGRVARPRPPVEPVSETAIPVNSTWVGQ